MAQKSHGHHAIEGAEHGGVVGSLADGADGGAQPPVLPQEAQKDHGHHADQEEQVRQRDARHEVVGQGEEWWGAPRPQPTTSSIGPLASSPTSRTRPQTLAKTSRSRRSGVAVSPVVDVALASILLLWTHKDSIETCPRAASFFPC